MQEKPLIGLRRSSKRMEICTHNCRAMGRSYWLPLPVPKKHMKFRFVLGQVYERICSCLVAGRQYIFSALNNSDEKKSFRQDESIEFMIE